MARRAGRRPATNAARAEEQNDRDISGKISRADPEEQRAQQASRRERADQADRDSDRGHRQALTQNHHQHLPALRAERHPNSDFPRPLRDIVGDHTVNADRGKDDRDRGEDAPSNPVLKRDCERVWLTISESGLIIGTNCCASISCTARRIIVSEPARRRLARAHHEVHVAIGILSKGKVEFRSVRFRQTAMFRRPDDADDLARRVSVFDAASDVQTLPEWVLVREIFLRKRFVDQSRPASNPCGRARRRVRPFFSGMRMVWK